MRNGDNALLETRRHDREAERLASGAQVCERGHSPIWSASSILFDDRQLA
jgi:hypothetical protein